MSDGLMMHRCRIVWDSLCAIIIPFILWSVTLVLGILLVWLAGRAGTDIFNGNTAKFSLAYYTISVSLTAMLTCMICCRLVGHARTMQRYLGEEYAAPYFSVIVLLVESVLPLTLIGIVFLVLFGVGSQQMLEFSHVYTLMMCVSPQMLILRVAQGNAWQRDTMTRRSPSAMRFSAGYIELM
ncbi:hypothetical protein OG21DRAFT_1334506 [Imleria badia]|nr:hypothetical protein OG21DRAFT_1334506 [Imleria badia]